ncbi:hypothetical protein Hanom_Chr07g00598341 [Helianthus anomalus]
MNKMSQVHMSSSESSSRSEGSDPVMIVSEEEISLAQEMFTSDFEVDPEMITDDDDLDDVLALPLPIHDQLSIGTAEHFVEPFPVHAIPFAAIPSEDWSFIDDLENDVATLVVPIADVPSDSDLKSDVDYFDLVISSALFAAGLRVYPTGDDDDTMSAMPPTPTHVSTPPHTSAQISSLIRRIRELEFEVTHLHSLIFPTPPPSSPPYKVFFAGTLLE